LPGFINAHVHAAYNWWKLKTWAKGGVTTVRDLGAFGQSGWPLLSPEQAKALVDTTHERGKPVTAHVTSARDLNRALDAGVDEIAHMVVDELSEQLIARMIESGTRWVPTLELWQRVSRLYAISHGRMAIKNLALFVEAGGEVALGTDYAGSKCQFRPGNANSRN